MNNVKKLNLTIETDITLEINDDQYFIDGYVELILQKRDEQKQDMEAYIKTLVTPTNVDNTNYKRAMGIIK